MIFGKFGIFKILNTETLVEASGHSNMPKDIGIFNNLDIRDIREIRDFQDIELRDIGGGLRTFQYALGYWDIQQSGNSGYSGNSGFSRY